MERNLDEVLASQEKMLERLGRPAAPRDEMKRAFEFHLEKLRAWLSRQPHIKVLTVSYNDLLTQAEAQAKRVSDFLDGRADVKAMTTVVDPSLYRNKQSAASSDPAR